MTPACSRVENRKTADNPQTDYADVNCFVPAHLCLALFTVS